MDSTSNNIMPSEFTRMQMSIARFETLSLVLCVLRKRKIKFGSFVLGKTERHLIFLRASPTVYHVLKIQNDVFYFIKVFMCFRKVHPQYQKTFCTIPNESLFPPP